MVKETCMCGVHVAKASIVVAAVNIIVQGLACFWEIYDLESMAKSLVINNATDKEDNSFNRAFDIFNYYFDSFLLSLLPILFIVASFVLIYAIRAKNPVLYRPYLLFTLIDLFLNAVTGLLFLICAVLVFAKPKLMLVDISERLETGFGFGLMALLAFVFLGLEFYFSFIVVNRSRVVLTKSLKKKNHRTHPTSVA